MRQHVVLRHISAVRLGSLPEVDLDAQRMAPVHRPVMIYALRERMPKLLERSRVGNGRNRDRERQCHKDHTCYPNLHTTLPKSRPGSTVAVDSPFGNGLNEVFGESLLALPNVKS
jgi:hypothetical protein